MASLIVLMIGIFLNQLSAWYIRQKYGQNLPVLSDLILDKLPYLRIQWLYDLIPLIAILFFIYYAYKYDFERVPFFALLFGLSQLVRGFFIVLTPFGSPNAGAIGLWNTTAFKSGIYPSGHTGATFLAFLLSQGRFKVTFLIFSMLVMVTLLLGRGHYSIDIFSAVLFNYAIYCFGTKYFSKFVLRKEKEK